MPRNVPGPETIDFYGQVELNKLQVFRIAVRISKHGHGDMEEFKSNDYPDGL